MHGSEGDAPLQGWAPSAELAPRSATIAEAVSLIVRGRGLFKNGEKKLSELVQGRRIQRIGMLEVLQGDLVLGIFGSKRRTMMGPIYQD